MAADWTSSAVNAGAGVVGGLIGLYGAKKQRDFEQQEAEKQREWSEQMQDKQNEWSLNMWNKTNEYNSPSAQVERLREAGLNPLYYGLDGSSANGLESAQALGYERASSASFDNPMAAGIEGALKAAQIAQIQAVTKKTRSETKMIDAKLPYEIETLRTQIRKSGLDADAQETINHYLDRQQEAEIRLKNASAAEADAAVEKAAAEIEKMDYEKTTMYIGWLETQERILNLQKQRDLTDKQIEELGSLIAKNNAEAAKIGLDIKNYDDITVLGTASQSMRFGPVGIQAGEPITLGMKKAAEVHKKQLEKDKKNKKPQKSMSDIKKEYPE